MEVDDALDVVLLGEDADERLAATGARIEARSTERIGGRLVTRALLVSDDAPRLAEDLREHGAQVAA